MDFETQLANAKHSDLILYTCPTCGTIDELTKKNFLRRKNKCLVCATQQKKIERDIQIKNVLLDKNIEIIGELPVRIADKVTFRCTRCGRIDEGALVNLQKGRKKCNCNPERQFKTNITHEEFLEKVSPAIKAKFNILDNYKSRNTKMLIECKNCHTQSYRWGLTLIEAENIKCRCERRTKGEDLVLQVLEKLNIAEYIEQYRIQAESGRTYILDFYLPSYNLVIEYNGIQHYEPVPFFGGEEKFKQQVERDAYIKEYCLKNHLTLLTFNDKDNFQSITHTLLEFSKTFND